MLVNDESLKRTMVPANGNEIIQKWKKNRSVPEIIILNYTLSLD